MRINIYGVPPNVLTAWALKLVFRENLNTWVDLACGNGEFTRLIDITPIKGLGVDVSEDVPLLPKNFVYEREKISDWIEKNKDRNFDVVSSFEFIEHAEKNESLDFIEQIQKIAKMVIISTPSGFLRQDGETDVLLKDNPWLWHRCGFSPEELEKLGFTVFVLKNVHYMPAGNDRSFDKLVALWGVDALGGLTRKIRIKSVLYNFIPRHLYRTIRDNILRTLF